MTAPPCRCGRGRRVEAFFREALGKGEGLGRAVQCLGQLPTGPVLAKGVAEPVAWVHAEHVGQVKPMTQQYLAGELSLLLGQLQAATTNEASARYLAYLRREAETWPLGALPVVAVRALALTDTLCWESLARADAVAFARQAAVSADLYEFAVCARLLDDE